MKQALSLSADLRAVAWALNIYRLFTSLIGVFIPLIILKSGGTLRLIGVFYGVYALLKLGLNYQCMKLITRRGAHFGLAMGFGWSAVQTGLILLFAHYHHTAILLGAAVTFALTNAFLWNSQHYFISHYVDDKTKSSNLAVIESFGRLANIVGPAIGGIVGSLFGPVWLLLVALAVLLLAVFPLRRMRHLPVVIEQGSDHIRYTMAGAPVGDLIANFSFNIETLIGTLAWPVYLAVVLHEYKLIGSVATIAAFSAIVTTLVAGKRGDHGHDRAVLTEGVVASSVIDIARLFASAIPFITAVSAAYQATLAYFSNAWTSTYYHHAKAGGVQYIISMEIACDLAYVCFWASFVALTFWVHSTITLFNTVFIIAAIAALGCLCITRQRAVA